MRQHPQLVHEAQSLRPAFDCPQEKGPQGLLCAAKPIVQFGQAL